MSIPRNHHFVSQVHIKNFFDNNSKKIFIFDKILDNFYFKSTSKSLFSEKDLNTIQINTVKDYETLEKDLNIFFEKDFAKYFLIVTNFINDFNYSEEVNAALYYFVKYGAIGQIRNPRDKKQVDDAIYKVFSELSKNSTPKLKRGIDEALSFRKKVKYNNSIQYSKFANDIVELMGDIFFRIEIPIEKEDYFLLPDFCAANVRERINEYFNPDVKEIAYIGLPLSSKIYVHFYSSKINNIKITSEILYIDSEKVFNLNEINLNYCESKVACESEKYLNKFIKNTVNH